MDKILKQVRVLKKEQRSPEKFDALNVFATWAQRHAVPVRQDDAVPRFAEFLPAREPRLKSSSKWLELGPFGLGISRKRASRGPTCVG